MCILLFAAPLAKFIPLSLLAAILTIVSYNMGERREIPGLLKLSRLEVGTWLITFGMTVFADLTVAVEAGMIMAGLVTSSAFTARFCLVQPTNYATGLQALEEFADFIHASGRSVILCGALERPAQMMRRADFEEHIGKENICANIQEALERARQLSGVV